MKYRQVIFASNNRANTRIEKLGYIKRIAIEDGTFKWEYYNISESKAISNIESGEWQFFTYADGTKAKIVVEKRYGKPYYLRTEKDDVIPNNLLSLPSCPDLANS